MEYWWGGRSDRILKRIEFNNKKNKKIYLFISTRILLIIEAKNNVLLLIFRIIKAKANFFYNLGSERRFTHFKIKIFTNLSI